MDKARLDFVVEYFRAALNDVIRLFDSFNPTTTTTHPHRPGGWQVIIWPNDGLVNSRI